MPSDPVLMYSYVVCCQDDELQAEMAARLTHTKSQVAMHKEMQQLLKRESDRRTGLSDWYAQEGIDFDKSKLLPDAGLPLRLNVSDAALSKRGKAQLGRKGSSYSSPAAVGLAIHPEKQGGISHFLSQRGRPPGSAMVSLEVPLPIPTGTTLPTCEQGGTLGASCQDGVELPILEKLALMCENLPANVFECTEKVGLTIPEFLIKVPDMMTVLFPDPGYLKLYESFGGLDQVLIKLRDELIDNPRELATLSEYCVALRAKGETWEAVDCFRWSLELVRTEQYDKSSGRWAQRNTDGHLPTVGTIVTDLKINYGETLLRAGLVEEAVAAFESTSTEEWLKGRNSKAEDFTIGKLATGHARDISATHTYASAREYIQIIEDQHTRTGGHNSWRVHHSPEYYLFYPVLIAFRWAIGTTLIAMLLMRGSGFRLWVQWPSLPCMGAPSHLAICCEFGGAVHVLHTRALQPNLDNAVSLAAAAAVRNGSGNSEETPVSPVFKAYERMGKRGDDTSWRDIEMKIELPSHQLVGHLELMAPLSCCKCINGDKRRGFCGRAICYSVAYTFADLDIELLKVSATDTGRDAKAKTTRRRGDRRDAAQDFHGGIPSLSAIRLSFVSRTVFATTVHKHTLHMAEAQGVFRLMSAIQNESKRLEQGRRGTAGRVRRRR